MTELLKVKVLNTGDTLEVPDVERLESAQQYLDVSDRIWSRRTNPHLAVTEIPSVLTPEESRDAINEVVGRIDKRFVISGRTKELTIRGPWPNDKATLSPAFLKKPAAAAVGTYNWDKQATWRHMDIDGHREAVEFTDGHTDFHRELFAKLFFQGRKHLTVLRWLVQRYQPDQNQQAVLYSHAWYSGFAESGYEGNGLHWKKLKEGQEIEFVKLAQRLGGISLDPQAGSDA